MALSLHEKRPPFGGLRVKKSHLERETGLEPANPLLGKILLPDLCICEPERWRFQGVLAICLRGARPFALGMHYSAHNVRG